jgi:hypothetical protein
MRRYSCLCGHGCCGIPILRLDGTPFGGPILTLERTNFQQLLIVVNLVLGARPITASRNSILSGVSVASSAVERAEELNTSETTERCVRVIGGVERRAGVKGGT